MATVIDVLGQPCPIPVVKAKNTIEALPAEGGVVQVLVDNATACENLSRMAQNMGHPYAVEERGDQAYVVTITVGSGHAETPAAKGAPAPLSTVGAGLVAAIGSDAMGHGSDELGKILIKGFIFSLSQLEPAPKAALFFNSGVQLTVDGANTLEDLRALEGKGTLIRVCGTCVDYYGCKERVAVGEITNMYGIVELMSGAQPLISL